MKPFRLFESVVLEWNRGLFFREPGSYSDTSEHEAEYKECDLDHPADGALRSAQGPFGVWCLFGHVSFSVRSK